MSGSPRPTRSVLRRVLIAISIAAIVVASTVAVDRWRTGDAGASDTTVYVALGASDAVGIGSTSPAREGWVAGVHAGLAGDVQLVNLGINGAELDDVLSLQVPVALDAGADLVTLWPGVNDLRAGVSLEMFAEQLDSVLRQLAARDVTLVVLNIPDLRPLPEFSAWDPARLDARVREWNAAIDVAATHYATILVDLYGASFELAAHPEYVSADGLHPSAAGYARIAELVLAALAAGGHDALD